MRMRPGLLSTMARAELAVLVEDLVRRYAEGATERLAREDPRWPRALDAAEREVGALLHALREADVALAEWPRAIGRLAALWTRVLGWPSDDTVSPDESLDEATDMAAREVA